MDFSWDETTLALCDATLALVSKLEPLGEVFAPHSPQWRACAEAGLTGLSVPVAFGGMGLSALATARLIEALGYGNPDMGLAFSISAHLFAVSMPIAEFGNEAQKSSVLAPLARGEWVGANAITEAEAGSDVFALETAAVRDGSDWILDGAKSYVTNGPLADLLLVYAKTSAKGGFMGLSAFAIPRETEGLKLGKPFAKMGLRSAPICSLYLERCRVPGSAMVGKTGQGAMIFTNSMLWERACLFAGYVGMMQRQLERCVDYAKKRKQFGKNIGKFQAVAHAIADMKLRLESSRLLLYKACWEFDQGNRSLMAIAMAKLAVSEAAIQSGIDAIRLHGGIGYTSEFQLEQGLRDAIPATIFSGTSEIQRDLIAQELGL